MRLFKASQRTRSAEDEAAAVRLLAIASRSKGRLSDCWVEAWSEVPELPTASEDQP
jgi:hypothetical protein